MMPEMKEIDKCIKELKYIADSPPQDCGGFHPNTILTAKHALFILTHVKQHGLGLSDGEIANIVLYQVSPHPVTGKRDIGKISKAIVDKQKAGVK